MPDDTLNVPVYISSLIQTSAFPATVTDDSTDSQQDKDSNQQKEVVEDNDSHYVNPYLKPATK